MTPQNICIFCIIDILDFKVLSMFFFFLNEYVWTIKKDYLETTIPYPSCV